MTADHYVSLIERLVQRMDLDRIFLFSYPFGGTEEQHLLLVVNPVQGISPNAMKPIVSLCMADTVELGYDIILMGEWQNRLKQGSLYYTYASLPSHQRYTNSKKKSSLFSRKVISGLLEVAQLNYEKCKKSAAEFMDACHQYQAKGDYGQALSMLHQFVEFRLKGFQSILGINSGKSHNIKHMIKMMRGALELTSIFDYEGPWSVQLSLLDQSYNRIKKQDSFIVSPEDLELIMDRSVQLAKAMDGMVETMTDHVMAYREGLKEEAEQAATAQHAVSVQSVSSPTAATIPTQIIHEDFAGFPWLPEYKEDANKLLDKIRTNHNPEQISMLNYHTGGFSGSNLFQQTSEDKEGTKVELYLVVIMKNTGPFSFKCFQVGVVSAMVVYLNVREVEKKLATGDRFVHTLWTKGHILRRKAMFEPKFTVGEVDWKKEYEEVETVLLNAEACITNLKHVLKSTTIIMVDTGLIILRNILEITVTTYINSSIGHIPYRADLAELIDWCGVIDREIIDFIWPKNDQEKARMNLLILPARIWWSNIAMGLSKTQQSFYREQAESLEDFFNKKFQYVLQQLKQRVKSQEVEPIAD